MERPTYDAENDDGDKLNSIPLSQSTPPDNLSTIELENDTSFQQIDNPKIDSNISTSTSSLSVEDNTHQRRTDKEATVDQIRSDLKTLKNQTKSQRHSNILCDSTISTNPDVPVSIFSTIRRGSGNEEENNEYRPKKELSIRMALLLLLLIFAIALGALTFVYSSFPKMEESETRALKFPTNIDDAKLLGQGLCSN